MNKPLSIPTNWTEDFFEQLEGFLQRFEADGCRGQLCETGGYCTAWAEKAVRREGDPARRTRFVEFARAFVAALNLELF